MGGGAIPEAGGGGKRKKKALDAVINVVPAIDLLSCCITFLLYTAVWTQISRLQVQQFGAGAPEPPTTEQQKALMVTLAVSERGMNLTTSAGLNVEIPMDRAGGAARQDYKALDDRLKQLRSEHPDAAAVTVSAEDTVSYGDLVQVIDTCMGQGLVSVSVTGV
ncbi:MULTISPECIES: biopolymer transporter ExbD [unclassified Anaeromyxobacter]|jgi:biopolymer transport protein ExbD|uniref:ExbD/TolR family protein n=1 Tax=unclassified Anaeromyxobacter TaxID=2620896 RepID=UPI00015F91D6|nr:MULTISPECIES: biopolymer transporter ExbD [unclassified Anaeromyxobacter]ACG75648.1 TolR protein [Anaeromyxobacter sp. K]GAO01386.1 biopolymer transport protein ExbD/TolR [Anaeromyxobacter sp. PSR-1]